MNLRVTKCPACGENDFAVEKFRCRNCGTAVEGKFSVSRLANLTAENLEFVETFLKCRGNIKDVEKELGISYPTVRGRLDRVIKALGYGEPEPERKRKEILESLQKGDLTAEEAVKAIQEIEN